MISKHIDIKDAVLYYLDETDSTNNFAKKLIEEGLDKSALIVARSQTEGRGRQGKTFFSPADSGIYMTVVLCPNSKINTVVTLTAKIACIVAKSIFEVYGIQTGIKWVNDLYLNDKKICGILCEAVNDYKKMLLKHAIIGIGINMTTMEFPNDIKETAGSLFDISDDIFKKSTSGVNIIGNSFEDYPFKKLAESIFRSIQEDYHKPFSDFVDYYRDKSIVINRRIYFIEEDNRIYGKVLDIDSDGGLEVLCDNGEKKILRSGEITLRVTGGIE